MRTKVKKFKIFQIKNVISQLTGHQPHMPYNFILSFNGQSNISTLKLNLFY